jgi:hypothetical protein
VTSAERSQRASSARAIVIGLLVLFSPLLAAWRPVTAEASPRAASDAPVGSDPLTSSHLIARIRAGRPVELAGIVVEGDLDLRTVGTVAQPIRCIGCRFDGNILASDVEFRRIVDLTGAHFKGSVDLRGAIFDDALLLGAGEQASRIDGSALFPLTTFRDRAAFDGSLFRGEADFSGASFLADVSFADAVFRAAATFEFASFGGNAAFSSTGEQLATSGVGSSPEPCSAQTTQGISFLGTTFRSAADFRQREFCGDADFRSVVFAGALDLTLARFGGTARFDNVVFEGRTSFRIVTFSGDAEFDGSVAAGPLNLQAATAEHGFSLFGVNVTGSLSLSDMDWVEPWDAGGLSAGNLSMDLTGVTWIRGPIDKEDMLDQVERSAAARGDLAGANNARYELLSLQAARAGGVHHFADSLGYRLIAGYLVRPSHPFFIFLGLLIVVALFRTVSRYKSLTAGGSTPAVRRADAKKAGRRIRTSERATLAFLGGLAETARRAIHPKPDLKGEQTDLHDYRVAALVGAEYLAFKVLIALMLLGLANSNDTLRQLIDAVRG